MSDIWKSKYILAYFTCSLCGRGNHVQKHWYKCRKHQNNYICKLCNTNSVCLMNYYICCDCSQPFCIMHITSHYDMNKLGRKYDLGCMCRHIWITQAMVLSASCSFLKKMSLHFKNETLQFRIEAENCLKGSPILNMISQLISSPYVANVGTVINRYTRKQCMFRI